MVDEFVVDKLLCNVDTRKKVEGRYFVACGLWYSLDTWIQIVDGDGDHGGGGGRGQSTKPM